MPSPHPFLTATWRYLAMLNYEVDPAVLQSSVPAGTELDFHDGRCFLSVVGFRFLDTRVLGVPIPFHRNFEEVNLRFYVRRETSEGVKRGVVFIKEIVPRYWIAMVARRTYGERYHCLPMRHSIESDDDHCPGCVEYGWCVGGVWQHLKARTEGASRLPDSGSLEEFITEHYWGYASQRDGSTIEYQVEHPPWRVWSCHEASISGDLEALYGVDLAPFLKERPQSAFVADGSEIVVRWGRRI